MRIKIGWTGGPAGPATLEGDDAFPRAKDLYSEVFIGTGISQEAATVEDMEKVVEYVNDPASHHQNKFVFEVLEP